MAGGADEELLTIGAVRKLLEQDFPEISISKIRYLEDRGLVTPQRTPGGYRLFSTMDVERLRTILRLQRDEFLPLGVIGKELDGSTTGSFSVANQAKQLKRANLSAPAPARRHSSEEMRAATGVSAELLADLEAFNLIAGTSAQGYDETDREVVQTMVELSQYGVEPRHLRFFRNAADREASLFEQLLATGLRSKNPERRREAISSLENLAALASHLRHLMLVATLRRMTA